MQDIRSGAITLPAISTLLVGWLGLALMFCFVFWYYPGIFATASSKVLGGASSLLYLADHPAIYAKVQIVLNGLYLLTSVAMLDFVALLFVYRLLDEVQNMGAGWKGVLGVSLRALWRLLIMQLILGIIISLCAWGIKAYNFLYLLPLPFTSLPEGALLMALWLVSLVLYAFAYAISKPKSKIFRTGRLLLKNYLQFWFVLVVLVFLIAWAPAALMDKLGLNIDGAGAAVCVFVFSLVHVGVLAVLVSYFLNVPDVWELEEPALTAKSL